MGERGPAPKPTALRLLHGETKPSRVGKREPMPRSALPVMPEWLPEKVQVVWRRTVDELAHMHIVTAADGDALAVYCQAVVHYEDACRLVNTAGMLIRGRLGEVVKNPAMQFVRDQGLLIKVMAGQFGLTPAARVGLEAGEAPESLAGPERLLS